jgi:hypothetical protein
MISYQLSKMEVFRWFARRYRGAACLILLMIVVGAFFFMVPGSRYAGAAVVVLMLFAAYDTGAMIFHEVNSSRWTEPVIDFNAVGFTREGPTTKVAFDWSWFKAVSEDSEYFYLDRTLIIPKRAFASDEERDAFRRFAKQGTMNGR